jgi:hypothetical protein
VLLLLLLFLLLQRAANHSEMALSTQPLAAAVLLLAVANRFDWYYCNCPSVTALSPDLQIVPAVVALLLLLLPLPLPLQ